MKLHKFFGILSLIIPLIFSALFVVSVSIWDGNALFTYLFYCSLILSSILIAIGVFLSQKNKYIAYINIVSGLVLLLFTILQITLSNNHELSYKYLDLLLGGVFSLTLTCFLVLTSGIYLIRVNKNTNYEVRIIDKKVRLFGIIGLIVYLTSFALVIPSYFLDILFPWSIFWFVIQGLVVCYLIFLSILKKIKKIYIPSGINLILYIITLIFMIVSKITEFGLAIPAVLYFFFGLITIVGIVVNLCMLIDYEVVNF